MTKKASRLGHCLALLCAATILAIGAAYLVASIWPYDDLRVEGEPVLVVSETDLSPIAADKVYRPGEPVYVLRPLVCNDGVATVAAQFLQKRTPDGAVTEVDSGLRVMIPAPEEPACSTGGVLVLSVPPDATCDREWRIRTESTYSRALGRVVAVDYFTPWFRVAC